MKLKAALLALQSAAAILLASLAPPPSRAIAVIAALALVALALAGHLLSRSVELRLRTSIDRLSTEISVASSRVAAISHEIAVTIGEGRKTSDALFERAREMSKLASDFGASVSAALEQIKSSVSMTAEAKSAAVEMEDVGRVSCETVSGGISKIMGIVGAMGDIRSTSLRANERIEKLSSASGSILAISEKISEISEQMHIIAINASVEAARAGKSGESFAVVAKSFRDLAAVTDRSSREISELVGEIGGDIAEVCRAVRENLERVEEGFRLSAAVEDSLKEISASFADIQDTAGRLRVVLDTQATLSDEMALNVSRVESLVARMEESVGRFFDSAREQNEGMKSFSGLGEKLVGASRELEEALGQNSAERKHGKLDEKSLHACRAFFGVIENELCSAPELASLDPERHGEALSRFKSRHPMVEAVWTNLLNGRFVCSIPSAGIANAAMRDWFKAAAAGEKYISPIYISGITKSRCVTLSMPLRGDGGEIRGVVGVDLSLAQIGRRAG